MSFFGSTSKVSDVDQLVAGWRQNTVICSESWPVE